MGKLNNSYFESIQEILSTMEFHKETCEIDEKTLSETWKECVGEKIAEVSQLSNLSQNGVLTVICANSLVANELYLERNNLLQIIREKFENLGIEIKAIKIDKNKMARG